MNKLKTLVAIAAITVLSSISANAYNDVFIQDDYYSAVERLATLDVINGYEDGSFRPDKSVTREEFAKMIVCAINKTEDSVAMGSFTCKFSDVEDGRWSIPYINYISHNSIIKGYADGSFQPLNNINYAEASTILCRILGYTEKDVGFFWPSNFTAKADSLGLRVSGKDIHEPLNRAEIAKMLDLALFMKVNPNAFADSLLKYSKNSILLEAAGYNVIDECFIIATNEQDDSLAQNQVKTSEGTYKVKSLSAIPEGGTYGTVVLDDDNKVVVVFASPLKSLTAGITNINGYEMEYIASNGTKATMRLDTEFETYIDYTKHTYASALGKISAGDDITFYGFEDGQWEYAVVNSDIIKPILASHAYSPDDNTLEGISINKTNLIVYKDGDISALDKISENDVVYYNTRTNIMDVYSKKVTGIYYDAYPSKAYVSKVTVGGKEYNVATSDAANMLGASNNAYSIGDKVTLILGKNDEVVFVKDINGFNKMEYGIILSTSVRTKQSGDNIGETEFVAKLLMADGNESEFVTDKDYDDYKGKLVKMVFENKKVKLITSTSTIQSAYGNFIPSDYRLGNAKLSENVVIFQLISNNDSGAAAEVLDIRVLDNAYIPQAYVLNTISGNSSDINILYVEKLTDSSYMYGILTKITAPKGDSTKTKYTIFTNGVSTEYTSPAYITVSGGPVKFTLKNGQIDELNSLYTYVSSSTVDAIDQSTIKIGGNIYEIADNVVVYEKPDATTYKLVSYDDLMKADTIKSMTLYSDKTVSQKGKIKVITVSK